jgi:hypothetical protein
VAGILFTVLAWDTNCQQHIPQRFDAPDVAAALAERDQRIAALETEIRSLRQKSESARKPMPRTTESNKGELRWTGHSFR